MVPKTYIAMPESIYLEIRSFLETMPYRQVHGVIRALDTTVKKLPEDIIAPSEAPSI